ncbi:autotransporter-associated beta strand repeat-containing protein [Roseibacillus persicicus]|uniref:autotransporter-associated beta strand repeat-containing protein n=1 Tax=Roseibacillus persicicus TaxID=454148 RepID=UPI0016733E7D|nr:autotransporter-associated beta strand repeat-containing protein [Roseibacillus persicicus]
MSDIRKVKCCKCNVSVLLASAAVLPVFLSETLLGAEIAKWDFVISGDSAQVANSHSSVLVTPVTMAGGVSHTQDSDSGAWRTRGYTGGEGYVEFSITAGMIQQVTLESLEFAAFARAASSSGGAWSEPEIILEYDVEPAFSNPVFAGALDMGDDLTEGAGEGPTYTSDASTFFSSDLVIEPMETYYFRLRASDAVGATASRNQIYFNATTDLTLSGQVNVASPALTWTGSESANWNTIELNFSEDGLPSLFETGDGVTIGTATDIVVDAGGITAGELYITNNSTATFELQGGDLVTDGVVKAGNSNFEIKGNVDTGSGVTLIADGTLQVDGGTLTTSGLVFSGGGELRIEAGGSVTNSADSYVLADMEGANLRTNSNITASVGRVVSDLRGSRFAKQGSGELIVTGDFTSSDGGPLHLDYNGGVMTFDGANAVALTDGEDYSSCQEGLNFIGSQVSFHGLKLGRNEEEPSDDRDGLVVIQGTGTRIESALDEGENVIYEAVRIDTALELFVPFGNNDFYFDFPIMGVGDFIKTGEGEVYFDAENTYTGDTIVQAGTLLCAEPSFGDTSRIEISGTGGIVLSFTGEDQVGKLVIEGEEMQPGIWGPRFTDAQFESDYLFGTGVLHVTGAEPSDYDDWVVEFGVEGEPAEDDDLDGVSNAAEYAFGTEPTSAGSVSPYQTDLDKATGLLSYTRRKPALSDLTYTYGYSTTLEGEFTSFAPIESSDGGDPVEVITLTLPSALLEEDALFVRVFAN